MTFTEAKDILITRLSFEGGTPVSGRFFEGEHHLVTLDNIKSVQPDSNITDTGFNALIVKYIEQNAYFVLADVFDKDTINDDLVNCNERLFDSLLSYSMAMKVINLILSSTRSNEKERILRDIAPMIMWDLNGSYKSSKGDISYAREQGLAWKYKLELKRVKGIAGGQRKLVTSTIGSPRPFPESDWFDDYDTRNGYLYHGK